MFYLRLLSGPSPCGFTPLGKIKRAINYRFHGNQWLLAHRLLAPKYLLLYHVYTLCIEMAYVALWYLAGQEIEFFHNKDNSTMFSL
jgi:hypothetical protein